jgi:large subunit ribosomal protein L23
MIPQQIIVRPVVTEKSTDQQSQHNQYVFEVAKKANKIEIRKAVEMVFGVRVTDVSAPWSSAAISAASAASSGRRFWKKAIVTLHPGDSIDFYGEQDLAADRPPTRRSPGITGVAWASRSTGRPRPVAAA